MKFTHVTITLYLSSYTPLEGRYSILRSIEGESLCGKRPLQHPTIVSQSKVTKRNAEETINLYISADPCGLQEDAFERDAFEVLRLVRFMKNLFTTINRVPAEVFSLSPDYCCGDAMDQYLNVYHIHPPSPVGSLPRT